MLLREGSRHIKGAPANGRAHGNQIRFFCSPQSGHYLYNLACVWIATPHAPFVRGHVDGAPRCDIKNGRLAANGSVMRAKAGQLGHPRVVGNLAFAAVFGAFARDGPLDARGAVFDPACEAVEQ